MPAINPRIHVVLEKPLYKAVEKMARKDGVSLSLKVRDLIRDAVRNYEDIQLMEFAKSRSKTFTPSRALTHEQVWDHLKKAK